MRTTNGRPQTCSRLPQVPVTPAAGLKICGVTHPDDVEACLAHGVDAIGLNLWPGSPRALTVEAAEPLADRVHADAGHGAGDAPPASARRSRLVGVFVDATEAEMREAFARLRLDLLQPHGDAPIERTAALGLPYVWVIRGTPPLSSLRVPDPPPAWILLDARVPGYGGQGITTDWSWAEQAVRALAPTPVWLAGGITPGNAARALDRVAPAGLDVASGAERGDDPRRKDPAAIAVLASICKNRSAP